MARRAEAFTATTGTQTGDIGIPNDTEVQCILLHIACNCTGAMLGPAQRVLPKGFYGLFHGIKCLLSPLTVATQHHPW